MKKILKLSSLSDSDYTQYPHCHTLARGAIVWHYQEWLSYGIGLGLYPADSWHHNRTQTSHSDLRPKADPVSFLFYNWTMLMISLNLFEDGCRPEHCFVPSAPRICHLHSNRTSNRVGCYFSNSNRISNRIGCVVLHIPWRSRFLFDPHVPGF